MFCPALGIAEDPVSGNAHGLLGAYLAQLGLLARSGDGARFTRRPGALAAPPRPGRGRAGVQGRRAGRRYGSCGQAVSIFETEIVPARSSMAEYPGGAEARRASAGKHAQLRHRRARDRGLSHPRGSVRARQHLHARTRTPVRGAAACHAPGVPVARRLVRHPRRTRPRAASRRAAATHAVRIVDGTVEVALDVRPA